MATAEQGSEQGSEQSVGQGGGPGVGQGGAGEAAENGRVDGVALLYIAGGIPAMVVFFLVLFAAAHACDIPA